MVEEVNKLLFSDRASDDVQRNHAMRSECWEKRISYTSEEYIPADTGASYVRPALSSGSVFSING